MRRQNAIIWGFLALLFIPPVFRALAQSIEITRPGEGGGGVTAFPLKGIGTVGDPTTMDPTGASEGYVLKRDTGDPSGFSWQPDSSGGDAAFRVQLSDGTESVSPTAEINFDEFDFAGSTAQVGGTFNVSTAGPRAVDAGDGLVNVGDTKNVTLAIQVADPLAIIADTLEIVLDAASGLSVDGDGELTITSIDWSLLTNLPALVNSVSGGDGLSNSGSASAVVLDVDTQVPLTISGTGNVSLSFDSPTGLMVDGDGELAIDSTKLTPPWGGILDKPATFTPSAHASSHEDSGGDELDVTGLSGLLADAQQIYTTVDGEDEALTLRLNLWAGTNVTLNRGASGSSVDVTITATGSGSGDVTGPASSTNNAVAVFDGTTGKVLKNSSVLISAGEVQASNFKDTSAASYAESVNILTQGKGYLLVHDGTGWRGIQPGSDGEVLGADSGTATGLGWISAAVTSVSGGDGLSNSGSASAVVLDVDTQVPLTISGTGNVSLSFDSPTGLMVDGDGELAIDHTKLFIDWENLLNVPLSFTPSAHATSHESGGTDELSLAGLSVDWADIVNEPNLVETSRTISAGTGLSGGGDLSANRTLTLAMLTQDEGVSTGQTGNTLNVSGNSASLSAGSGVATVNVSDTVALRNGVVLGQFNHVSIGANMNADLDSAGILRLSSDGGGGGSSTVDVQVFYESGTWTKPTGGQVRGRVLLMGSGGAGGSGRRGAAGSNRSGGSGGAGGTVVVYNFNLDDVDATEAVTVGTTTTGGAPVTSDDTNGNAGDDSNYSSFAHFTTELPISAVFPSRGGAGGSNTTVSGGSAGRGTYDGVGTATASSGGASSTSTQGNEVSFTAAYANLMIPLGGGGGGGISSSNVEQQGGWSGASNAGVSTVDSRYKTPSAGGTTGGGDGGSASPSAFPTIAAGVGGGGGGGGGGDGGDGGYPGGGGGGGGASLNGTNSGAGGDGAAGIVIVECW